MAIRELKQMCKRYFEPVVLACGFKKIGELNYSRESDQLLHGMHFPRHAGRFTLDISWTYPIDGLLAALAFSRRIEMFCPEFPGWISFSDCDELERGFERMIVCVEEKILPFLDRFTELKSVVAAVESGEFSEYDVYGGRDPIWRSFFKGYVLLKLGRRVEAKACFLDSLASEKEWGRDQDDHPMLDARRRFTREALRELSVADGVGEVGNPR